MTDSTTDIFARFLTSLAKIEQGKGPLCELTTRTAKPFNDGRPEPASPAIAWERIRANSHPACFPPC